MTVDDVSSLSNKFSNIPKERATTMLSSHNDGSKMGVRGPEKLTDIIPDLPSTRVGAKTAKEG